MLVPLGSGHAFIAVQGRQPFQAGRCRVNLIALRACAAYEVVNPSAAAFVDELDAGGMQSLSGLIACFATSAERNFASF